MPEGHKAGVRTAAGTGQREERSSESRLAGVGHGAF